MLSRKTKGNLHQKQKTEKTGKKPERNKNKKHLELSVGSKKGKIRMDSNIEAPKSDLTPRDREVNGGYSNLGGFASRNLAKA